MKPSLLTYSKSSIGFQDQGAKAKLNRKKAMVAHALMFRKGRTKLVIQFKSFFAPTISRGLSEDRKHYLRSLRRRPHQRNQRRNGRAYSMLSSDVSFQEPNGFLHDSLR